MSFITDADDKIMWQDGGLRFQGWFKEIPAPVKKYYIHPDSLHLLEPQAGDIMGDIGGVAALTPSIVRKTEDGLKKYFAGIEGKCDLEGDERIISRNGIPFMWPECE